MVPDAAASNNYGTDKWILDGTGCIAYFETSVDTVNYYAQISAICRAWTLIRLMDHEVKTPPPARLTCFHSSISPASSLPSFYITLSHPPSVSKFHSFSLGSGTLFTPFNTENIKLILSKSSHLTASEMQFCSPNTKKGKYWLNGEAVWVPRVFVIVEHGHPHQSSHNPHHFHTPHS